MPHCQAVHCPRRGANPPERGIHEECAENTKHKRKLPQWLQRKISTLASYDNGSHVNSNNGSHVNSNNGSNVNSNNGSHANSNNGSHANSNNGSNVNSNNGSHVNSNNGSHVNSHVAAGLQPAAVCGRVCDPEKGKKHTNYASSQ